MRKKFISEVFLTSSYVTEESWLQFILAVSKLNGYFRKWRIFISIEQNQVRYFIKTNKILPPIISSMSDFLIKRIDESPKCIHSSSHIGFLYYVTTREINMLDIYDKNETRHMKKLKMSKITILPYKKDNFLSSTKLFFEKKHNVLIKRTALFNIPHSFLSIDFSKHNRFFYVKDTEKYLDIRKSLHLFNTDKANSILKIDAFPYLSEDYYLSQNNYDFNKHSVVIGASGTGKSKFLSSLITNIANNSNYGLKYKIVVIDPHASLEKDIGGLDNSSVIDFKSSVNGVNLFMNSSTDIVSSTELTLSLFKTLIADQYNSKLERVLRHSIYLLTVKKDLSFSTMRKLILDMEYRNIVIKELEDKLPSGTTDFFLSDFNELKAKSYPESISPIISFIDEIQLLPAFSDNTSSTDLKTVINNNFLTIFSLDQTFLGEKVTKTISGLLMQQILQLVQSFSFDEHIILLVDEVSVVENPILRRFLSEARKYNLSLILAQQYFSQISEELRSSIFANVINYYVFRVSKSDAYILEKNLQMEVAVDNSVILDNNSSSDTIIDKSTTIKMKLLTELSNRECIVRLSNNGILIPAFKGKTLDFTENPRKVLKNQILRTSPLEKEFNKQSSLKEEFSFNVGNPVISLKEIMVSQSTGRKKVNSNG